MIENKRVTQPLGVKTADTAAFTKNAQMFGNTFTRENYAWMLAGVVVIIIGMFVMSGGKSSNPAVFDQKEVYSTTRITIAPLLIVIGLALEVVAIFKRAKV